MSVAEYGVYRDFFQADQDGQFAFPCSGCKFRVQPTTSEPCKYCDHNGITEESFFCVLCNDHTIGDPQDEKFHLSSRTPAHIGPICQTCKGTILKDREQVTCDACGKPITDDQKDVGHECNLHEWCVVEGSE